MGEEQSHVQGWRWGGSGALTGLLINVGKGQSMGQCVGISAGRKGGNPSVSGWLAALETALESASSTSMPVDLYIGFVVKRIVV